MINQNFSFQGLTQSVVNYLNKSLEQLKQEGLNHQKSEKLHNFVTAEKLYLPTLKKLINLRSEDVLESSQAFILERQQFQTNLNKQSNEISDIYFSLPYEMCYFSIDIAHGFFGKGTFPYVPRCINNECQGEINIERIIYKKLLQYNQTNDFSLSVNQNLIQIETEYYIQEIAFYEDEFYIDRFQRKYCIDYLMEQINPQIMIHSLNELGQFIKTIQKEEDLFIYINYYLINTIKLCQWYIIMNTYQNEFTLTYPKTFEEFQNNESITLSLTRDSYADKIVKSGCNIFIMMKKNGQQQKRFIKWDIEEKLEDKIQKILQFENYVKSIRQNIKNYNYELYFIYQEPYIGDIEEEDDEIDEIFKRVKCEKGFIQFQSFVLTLGSEQMKLYNNQQQFNLTLYDSQLLELLLCNNDVEKLNDRLRWIIIRHYLMNLERQFHEILLKNDEVVEVIQSMTKKNITISETIKFSPQYMVYEQNVLQLTEILLDINNISESEIEKTIRSQILNARFKLIEKINQQ